MIIKQIIAGCKASIYATMKLVLTALKHGAIGATGDERLRLSIAYSLHPAYLPWLEVTDDALPAGDAGIWRGSVRLFLPVDASDSKVWTAAGDGAVHVGGGEHVAADDEAVHGVAEK